MQHIIIPYPPFIRLSVFSVTTLISIPPGARPRPPKIIQVQRRMQSLSFPSFPLHFSSIHLIHHLSASHYEIKVFLFFSLCHVDVDVHTSPHALAVILYMPKNLSYTSCLYNLRGRSSSYFRWHVCYTLVTIQSFTCVKVESKRSSFSWKDDTVPMLYHGTIWGT